MNLYITFDENETYNSKSYVYRDTIFNNKNLLFINIKLINFNNINIYSELNDENNHMVCDTNIIKDLNSDGMATKDTLIYGYLQNEKYFKDYKNDIMCLFKNDIYHDIYHDIKASCFLHIRRGDYVNNTSYVINYDKYYKSAIEYIESRYNNIHFYIFSDDIEY